MLHVKDFATDATHSSSSNPPPAAELGRGTSNYHAVFAAARAGALEHMFVEQEEYPDLPWKQALAVDAEYLEKFRA